MPFVLDASITMAWCFEDEATSYTDYVLELLNDDTVLVPAIWPLEVANALNMAERRKRLWPADTANFVELIRALPISVDSTSLERATGSVLDIAREQKLSSYDAVYLDLAMREGLPLATSDKALIAAANRLGVMIVPSPE